MGLDDGWVILTTADRIGDVRSILYGLSLRGIVAESRPAPSRRGDPYLIVVQATDLDRAQAAIGAVWDALFDTPRAVTPDGRCPFCGYPVLGLPRDAACPECGVNPDSVEARRAFRDGRRIRTKTE